MEYFSCGILKVKILESQIIKKFLGAKTFKGLHRIADIG